MTTDVTIIIPAWNAARHIGRAIDSGLAQCGLSTELIVVDDASTDLTSEVVRPFCTDRVLYLRLAANGGPAAARNAALAIARGRWIAVLDADDAMLPGRLAELVGTAEAGGFDIISDNMWVEAADGARELFFAEDLDGTVQRFGLGDYVLRNLMFARKRGDGYLKPIFRNDFLRRHRLRYDPALRIGEDFLLMAEALACGANYGRRRSAGYLYSTQAGSISHRLRHAHAEAMISGDLRFLARYGNRLQASDLSAMQVHLRRLREAAGFVAMVDAVKAGRPMDLLREAVRRPAAIRHFMMPISARLTRLRA